MKLGGWIVMITTMLMILTILGIDTGFQTVLSYAGITIDNGNINSDIDNSSFNTLIFLALAGLGGSAILVGLYGKGYDVSLILAPIIVAIGSVFAGSFISIISYVNGIAGIAWWMTTIVSIIFIGLGIGFFMACLDYFGGR